MNTMDSRFCRNIQKITSCTKRSMFGGIGLFHGQVMFALIFDGQIYVKGGGRNEKMLIQHDCEPFHHVKKRSIATINYFNISTIFDTDSILFDQLISNGIHISFDEKADRKATKRLRDLPNMQLRLERMVKKSGIKDVPMFEALGAAVVFKKVKHTYQEDVEITLLWKFAGAIIGCHWSLIREDEKSELLRNI